MNNKKKKKQAFSNNYTWSFQFKWKKRPFYEKEKKNLKGKKKKRIQEYSILRNEGSCIDK